MEPTYIKSSERALDVLATEAAPENPQQPAVTEHAPEEYLFADASPEFRRRGFLQEPEHQPGAQEHPYPGKAAADPGDPRKVGRVEQQKIADLA